MIRSIRAKFTFWFVGSFLLLLVVSGGVAEVLFRIFALKSIDAGLYNGAEHVEKVLSPCFPVEQYEYGTTFRDCFDKILRELFAHDLVYVQLLRLPEKGETAPHVLATSYNLRDLVLPFSQQAQQAIQHGDPLFETLDRKTMSFELRLLTVSIDIPNTTSPYILQLAIATGEQKDPLTTLRHPLASRPHIFMVIFPMLLVCVSALGYFFMKEAFSPIHKVVMLAKNITAEDLSHRIEIVKSADEIGELADTFNEMIARLERSFKQIQQFSGDVSHELKTPLTAIKGEIEVALRKERTKKEYQEILASLMEDTDKLGKIIEDLLFLSRMDTHTIPLTFNELPFDELLLEVYEDLYRLAQQKQITLNLKNIDQVNIMGDLGLMKRVLSNVIVNAIKYTPEGGKVELSMGKHDSYAVCTITDTGIGIPEEDLPYIFDRFYRVDHSRFHETGGSGLGLAIVQKIIEAHQGKIDVTSEIGKGTTFHVCLNSVAD